VSTTARPVTIKERRGAKLVMVGRVVESG